MFVEIVDTILFYVPKRQENVQSQQEEHIKAKLEIYSKFTTSTL